MWGLQDGGDHGSKLEMNSIIAGPELELAS